MAQLTPDEPDELDEPDEPDAEFHRDRREHGGAPFHLDDDQLARLEEIANRCPVHRAITGEVRVIDLDGGLA